MSGSIVEGGYIPVDGRPLRVQIGTRPLDLRSWIEIDDLRVDEMAQKDRLLAERHDEVVATMPRGDAAAQETLDLLLAHLPERFPEIYAPSAHGLIDRQRERDLRADAGHPIDAAGRLVQEDLCVMSKVDGRWILTAASLCFPSRWRLADKIGRDLHAIHGPVPFYEERIGAPVDSFFDRLAPQSPVWRLNWTLLDDAALFQPDAATRREAHELPEDLGTALHFRVERQTLRALPVSGDVLFTIRTYVRPLRDLEVLRPGSFALLADTLRDTAHQTSDYKGWAGLLDATIAWLREQPSSVSG